MSFWDENPPVWFTPDEFACRCGCGLNAISEQTVRKLDSLRAAVGHPVVITSGSRCPAWNKRSGGAMGSKHLPQSDGYSYAADLALTGPYAYRALRVALDLGFPGVGVAKSFIHLDDSPDRKHGTLWTY